MRNYGIIRELNPNKSDAASLQRAVGANRKAQNWAIGFVKQNLKDNEFTSWSYYSLRKEFNLVREEVCSKEDENGIVVYWSKEVPERALRSGIERASKGLANWKKNPNHFKFPSYRSRGTRDSVSFDTCNLSEDGMSVRVPKIGVIRLKEKCKIASGCRATGMVIKEKAGRWFVTIQIQEKDWKAPDKRDIKSSVGVDLGVGDRFLTLSDGTVADNPRFFRTGAKRLALLQRRMSRKQKGSKNRKKARVKVSRQHYKIACRRADFIHKLTTNLVETQDLICSEDLEVVGMKRALKLGKSVSDVALGEFRRQLEYKSLWYGTTLVVADRWFASSKICNNCKEKNSSLELSEREWCCKSCGCINDRDINAALNLRDYAVSSTVSACGGVEVYAVEAGKNCDEERSHVFSQF